MGYYTEFSSQLDLSRKLTDTELWRFESFVTDEHDNRDSGIEELKYSRYCDWRIEDFVNEHVLLIPQETSSDAEELEGWFNILVKNFFEPWGIKVNGSMYATGSSSDDHWRIDVVDNVYTTSDEEVVDEEGYDELVKFREYIKTNHKRIYNKVIKAIT